MPSAAKPAHRLTGTIERPGSTETLDKYPPPGTGTPRPAATSPLTQGDLATFSLTTAGAALENQPGFFAECLA